MLYNSIPYGLIAEYMERDYQGMIWEIGLWRGPLSTLQACFTSHRLQPELQVLYGAHKLISDICAYKCKIFPQDSTAPVHYIWSKASYNNSLQDLPFA